MNVKEIGYKKRKREDLPKLHFVIIECVCVLTWNKIKKHGDKTCDMMMMMMMHIVYIHIFIWILVEPKKTTTVAALYN
jgi:hypothetical protein